MNPTTNNVIVRILIGVTFVTVMASAAVPSAMRHRTQQNSEAILKLSSDLKSACEQHRDDSGILAIEFAAPDQSHDWSSSSFHRLSQTQHYQGWKGPYLNDEISNSDNPYGGHISLCSDWDHARNLKFEIANRGFGQFLILDQIPESAARIIDAELDGFEGSRDTEWNQQGRVRWLEVGGRLLIDLEVKRR